MKVTDMSRQITEQIHVMAATIPEMKTTMLQTTGGGLTLNIFVQQQVDIDDLKYDEKFIENNSVPPTGPALKRSHPWSNSNGDPGDTPWLKWGNTNGK